MLQRYNIIILIIVLSEVLIVLFFVWLHYRNNRKISMEADTEKWAEALENLYKRGFLTDEEFTQKNKELTERRSL